MNFLSVCPGTPYLKQKYKFYFLLLFHLLVCFFLDVFFFVWFSDSRILILQESKIFADRESLYLEINYPHSILYMYWLIIVAVQGYAGGNSIERSKVMRGKFYRLKDFWSHNNVFKIRSSSCIPVTYPQWSHFL